MTLLERLAPGPDFRWLALVVIVQMTLVILSAEVAARTVLARRAALRQRLWLCCLICILLGPAVAVLLERARIGLAIVPLTGSLTTPMANVDGTGNRADRMVADESDLGVPIHSAAGARFDQERSDLLAVESDELASASTASSGRDSDPEPGKEARAAKVMVSEPQPSDDVTFGKLQPFIGSLVLIWAIGVAVGIARLVRGWRELDRLSRSLQGFEVCGDGDFLGELRGALGLARLPAVYTSPLVSGPVAIGIFRPRVVLPERLASALSPRQLRDVLVHEFAHIVRGDTLIALLQRIAGVLYWPHPLVHRLNVQLARSREEVCDNYVLRSGDPCGYSRTLLQLSEIFSPKKAPDIGLGLSDTRWTLRDRVEGILDPARDGLTSVGPLPAAALALGLAMICVAAGAVRPTRAESEVAEPANEISPENPERVAQGFVVDEGGRPVANASVTTVFRAKTAEPATTAHDGSFKLKIGGFMLIEEDLVASADGGRLMGLGKYVEPRRAGSVEPIRIVLKPSRVTKVHVRDAKDQVVEGATVAAAGFDYNGDATTDARGEALLRFPADAEVRWVAGLKAGAGFDYFENYRSRPTDKIGPLPGEVTIRLDGSRTVRVKAVDTGGRPVPGVELAPWLIRKPEKLNAANIEVLACVRARTDDSGMATFNWLPANVENGVPIVVLLGEYSCPSSPTFSGGVNETVLEARLLRNTRIGGVVRHADGRPAAGILIRAEGRGATNHYCRRHTRSRDDGTYSFDVYPDQSYMVAVLDERWAAKSLAGVIVREGKVIEGLDITLTPGTLIRGLVTKGAGGPPFKGEGITLIEHGQDLPPALVAAQGGERTQSLPQWASTDAAGRYQLRVGPGRYRFLGPEDVSSEELTVENQTDIVRDFRMTESSEWKSLAGVAIERAPAGERVIADAVIEVAPIGRHGFEGRSVADSEGRFQLSVAPGDALTVFAHDRKGTIAGFTRIAADANDVRVYASPASRISGKVLDVEGRPVSGRRVQLQLATGRDFLSSSRFRQRAKTDAGGRYDFRGVVVGANAEVWVHIDDGDAFSARLNVERVDVRSPDPIEMPDVVVRKDSEKVDARARAVPANAAASYRPVAPGRPALEGVLREIGRDAVTPDMVDRAWLLTRPQFYWHANLDDVRKNLADRDFLQLVDQAARELSGKPADTLTVFRGALYFRTSSEIGSMKDVLNDSKAEAAKPAVFVRGTVIDAQSKKPIAGAVVYSADTMTHTDAAGAFQLRPKDARPRGMIWIEADGYALREYLVLDDASKSQDARIVLSTDAPITGQAIGPDNRPVAGAIVSVMVKHFNFLMPPPSGTPAYPNFGFPIEVRTDADGRYALRGLPAGLKLDWYEVRHPECRTLPERRRVLRAGESNDFKMAAGCKVSGVVVDEAGGPLAGAEAQLRKPGERGGISHSSRTGRDGRFQFGNVDPGRWTVLIQPRRHAPAHGTIIATVERAVDSQFVVGPSSYISGRVVGPDGKPAEGAAVGWAKPVDERGEEVEELVLDRITNTAKDGTFRFGPLAHGTYSLTGMASDRPRRIGHVTANANSPDVVIQLKPDAR